jgi:16S rRNA (uracil1498-N3)-methyltransferase
MRQSPAYVRQHRPVRLTRLYVDMSLAPGSLVELPKDTAAHIAKVLRARSGEAVLLFNGNGEEYCGVLETVRGNRASVAVGAAQAVNNESPLSITLLQCIPRGERMDLIVQKATELGVQHIVPVLSQRSVVRLDGAQARAKQAHWRAVAISACEQCGRARLPTVAEPQALLRYLGLPAPPGARRFVLEPAPSQPQPHGGAPAPPGLPAPVGQSAPPVGLRRAEIAVGPEGGFAAEELEAFQLAGFSRAALGPRVLRTETAAIAGVVWLQTIGGDLPANCHAPSRVADA